MAAESLSDYEKRYTVAAVLGRRYLAPAGGFSWPALRRDIILAAWTTLMTSLAGLAWAVLPLPVGLFLAAAAWFLTAVCSHYYYAGIERLLLQLPGVEESTRIRIAVTVRTVSFCLFFFLLSAMMHAVAIASIAGSHFARHDSGSLPPYERLPVLGILSITCLSLMFVLAGCRTRLRPAPRLEQASKLLLLAVLFGACSILGGYLFDIRQAVYPLLAAFLLPGVFTLAMLGLMLGLRRRQGVAGAGALND